MRKTEKPRAVRLRDVAAAAGVNPSIASRVLNDDPTLSARAETRERVRDAAQRLGYTPNAFARGLKLQRTTTLGLVLPNVANAVNADLIQGAERRAAHYGYVVLLADTGDFETNGDVHRRLLLERRVDGLVVASAAADDRLIKELNRHRVPYVLLNRRPGPGALSVSADDAAGMTLAVDHLVELGHVRLAHLAGPGSNDAAQRRLEGYRDAVARRGLAGSDVVVEADLTEEAGFEAVQQILKAVRRPTALIVASISQSIGAMAALRGVGLTVPGDISLVAFHDAPLAAYLDPPLTAIRMPAREVAETAVDQLIKVIAGEDAGDVIVPTPPEIIVRGSTAPPESA